MRLSRLPAHARSSFAHAADCMYVPCHCIFSICSKRRRRYDLLHMRLHARLGDVERLERMAASHRRTMRRLHIASANGLHMRFSRQHHPVTLAPFNLTLSRLTPAKVHDSAHTAELETYILPLSRATLFNTKLRSILLAAGTSSSSVRARAPQSQSHMSAAAFKVSRLRTYGGREQ